MFRLLIRERLCNFHHAQSSATVDLEIRGQWGT